MKELKPSWAMYQKNILSFMLNIIKRYSCKEQELRAKSPKGIRR